jgi:hypothetical protein
MYRQLDSLGRPQERLPPESAIYFIWNEDVLEYIGATKNMRQRWSQPHRRFRTICHMMLTWIPCEQEQLQYQEQTLIEQLHPKQNGRSTLPPLPPEVSQKLKAGLDALFAQLKEDVS